MHVYVCVHMYVHTYLCVYVHACILFEVYMNTKDQKIKENIFCCFYINIISMFLCFFYLLAISFTEVVILFVVLLVALNK